MSGIRLAGRGREQAAITALINNAAVTGGALVLTGEPGIGKSALLQAAEDVGRAAGVRVLTMAGVESEAQLPFAGLHLLLRRVLSSARGCRRRNATRCGRRSACSTGRRRNRSWWRWPRETCSPGCRQNNRWRCWLMTCNGWTRRRRRRSPSWRAARPPTGSPSSGRSGPDMRVRSLSAGLPELEVAAVDETAATQILRSAAGDLTAATATGSACRPAVTRWPCWNCRLPGAGPLAPTNDLQPVTLSVRLERAFAARIAQLPESTRDALLVARWTRPATWRRCSPRLRYCVRRRPRRQRWYLPPTPG